MVDWTAPSTLALSSFAFAQATVFMLGLYLWYFALSLRDAEWALLRRRATFKLVHVPYFVGRYAHLLAAVGIAVSTHMKNPPGARCSGLAFERFLAITEQIALAAASSNLALRATTLWRAVARVRYAIWAVCCAHFTYALTLGVAAVSRASDAATGACVVRSTPGPLVGFFIFTLVWDVAIMLLTLAAVRRARGPGDTQTRLVSTLRRQGVGYALVTTATVVPMTVVYLLQLNDVMNIFLIPVGCTISVIASSAAVTSLFRLRPELDGASEVQAPRRATAFSSSKAPGEFSTVINLGGMGTSAGSLGVDAGLEDYCSSKAETGTEREDASTRPLNGGLSDVELGRYGLAV